MSAGATEPSFFDCLLPSGQALRHLHDNMQGLYEKVIEELQIINQKLIVKNDYLCVDRQTLLEKNMKLEEENERLKIIMQSIVQSAGKSGHRDNCNHYNCNDEHNDEEKYDDKYDCCKDDHQLPTYSPYEEHPKDQFGIFWTTQSSIDAGMHTNTNALQNSLDTLRISDTNLLDFCDTFPTTNESTLEILISNQEPLSTLPQPLPLPLPLPLVIPPLHLPPPPTQHPLTFSHTNKSEYPYRCSLSLLGTLRSFYLNSLLHTTTLNHLTLLIQQLKNDDTYFLYKKYPDNHFACTLLEKFLYDMDNCQWNGVNQLLKYVNRFVLIDELLCGVLWARVGGIVSDETEPDHQLYKYLPPPSPKPISIQSKLPTIYKLFTALANEFDLILSFNHPIFIFSKEQSSELSFNQSSEHEIVNLFEIFYNEEEDSFDMCLNSFDTLNRADKFEPTFNVNVDVNVNVNVNDNGNGHGNDNSHRPTFPSSTIPVLSSLSLDSIQNSGQWPHTSNYQHDTNLLTSNTKDAKDIKAIDSLLLSDAQCEYCSSPKKHLTPISKPNISIFNGNSIENVQDDGEQLARLGNVDDLMSFEEDSCIWVGRETVLASVEEQGGTK